MPRPRCLVRFAGSDALHRRDLPPTLKQPFNPARLDLPLTELPGVGPSLAAEAGKLGLFSQRDLLFHFPRRHEDFSAPRQISQLRLGEEATVRCRVERVSLQRTRRRSLRIVRAAVSDATGMMEALWFNQDYLAGSLERGDELLLRGTYESRGTFRVRSHEITVRASAPGWQPEAAGLHTIGLVPVYPATEKISVKRLRSWLARVRDLAALLADPLPVDVRYDLRLPSLGDAVLAMHFPASPEDYQAAERRLIFEELYLMEIGLLSWRHRREDERRASGLLPAGALVSGYLEALPFALTEDQKNVCKEISSDLEREAPMQRLLQGDVGSGKTVVAVYAMLRAVESGGQAALMAPTEVLAEQHYLHLQRMLGNIRVEPARAAGSKDGAPGCLRIALLSSRLRPAERRRLLDSIAAGRIDIVVGTHALIQSDVEFARLLVVVVDEQHRFGVRQRDQLAVKAAADGLTPHMLHMTATPIPRTLALTLYGDLEVSTIRSLPAGRRPVKTWLVPEEKRTGAYGFIRQQLDAGRQCYIVCPLIEESAAIEARAVETEAASLSEGELKGYTVGVLHGQLDSARKQETMARFAAGRIQALVTTTVIEVGVDVSNATIIVIEEADRFGLAQLHQLRGRVGRGSHESCCLLFAADYGETARQRLAAMTDTNDGFRLADLDLQIRGEGQLFGERQSGLPELKLASLSRDAGLLWPARDYAAAMVESGRLERPENALLREAAARIFGEALEWLHRP